MNEWYEVTGDVTAIRSTMAGNFHKNIDYLVGGRKKWEVG